MNKSLTPIRQSPFTAVKGDRINTTHHNVRDRQDAASCQPHRFLRQRSTASRIASCAASPDATDPGLPAEPPRVLTSSFRTDGEETRMPGEAWGRRAPPQSSTPPHRSAPPRSSAPPHSSASTCWAHSRPFPGRWKRNTRKSQGGGAVRARGCPEPAQKPRRRQPSILGNSNETRLGYLSAGPRTVTAQIEPAILSGVGKRVISTRRPTRAARYSPGRARPAPRSPTYAMRNRQRRAAILQGRRPQTRAASGRDTGSCPCAALNRRKKGIRAHKKKFGSLRTNK